MQALDCTDIKALLSGLVDDEVDVETRHAAERHLADCRACRGLIDEAETLNGLIASETDAVRQELPADFANSVLGLTVHAHPAPRVAHGWTNWLGWLAAAASLLLAVSLYVMDRRPTPVGDAMATTPRAMPAYQPRSTVLTGSPSLDSETTQDATNRAADETRTRSVPTLASGPLLAREDAETLDSAALALEILLADDETFERLGEVRHLVDYEELLPRLAEARQRLSANDRPAVFACESALFSILYGSDDPADLAELAAAIDRSELPGQLMKISGRWTAAQSL